MADKSRKFIVALRQLCRECDGSGRTGTTNSNGEPTDCNGCHGSGVTKLPQDLWDMAWLQIMGRTHPYFDRVELNVELPPRGFPQSG